MVNVEGVTNISKERAILRKTGLRFFENRSLNEMTDDDCIRCLKYLQKTTGVYYVS